jgi:hypothetical protein
MPRLLTRLTIALLFLLIASIFFSINELRYIIWGNSIEARLIDAHAVPGRRRSNPPHMHVEYEFADGAQTRRESDDVDIHSGTGKAPTVPIEYIPGSASSRLKGNDHKGWLWVSGSFLIAGLGIGVLLWTSRGQAKPQQSLTP